MAKYTIFSNIISGSSAFIPAITGSLQGSASYAATASVAPLYTLNSVTASMLQPYVLNSATSSFVQNSQTGSFVTNSQTSSFVQNSQTSSMSVLSASYAFTASAASNFFVGNSLTASNALINGTITAQTLIVQTITSSTDFVTGSTRFGSVLTNTHQFTGSVSITGSLTVVGSISGNLTGSVLGTSSWAISALSSSYPITVTGSTLRSINPLGGVSGNSQDSIFFGNNAGNSATNAIGANFFGSGAGLNATNANSSNFFGISAGESATNASNSNFFGSGAGQNAILAANSNFLGGGAGFYAASASNSTLIGFGVGRNTSLNPALGIKSNNIIIGTNITLPDGTRDSINLGGILFGTGSYSTTTGNPFSGSVTIGRIGINKVTPNYTLDVSGSGNYDNGLTVTGSLIASTITGSLSGTSSWSQNAITASFAPSYVLNSQTGSFVLNNQTSSFVQNSQTSSFVTNAQTSSFVINSQTGSFAITGSNRFVGDQTITGSLIISSSAVVELTVIGNQTITGSLIVTQGVTGSLQGTSSWSQNVISASFASTASNVNILNQNVFITGALAIGTSSLGSGENTLVLGLSPNGIAEGEGGQLLLQAPMSASFVSASMLDNYQNRLRILKGTNFGSNAEIASWNMHTKQMSIPAYNSVSAFVGTAVANLAVDNSGNIITVSTSGGSVFPYTGNAQINGGLGVTGSIAATTIFLATNTNGAAYLRGGDDVELWDINVSNHLGIYGQQDQTVASIKLGNNGGILSGRSGSIGIGTILPVSGTLHVNGNVFANSLTGSLFGTSSFATTASFAISASWAPSTGGGGLKTKAGSVANTSFTGNPDKATVTFSTPFADTNYAVTVTGEDARSWTIESKAAGSFVINTNSNVALTGTTYWIATAYGETA